MPENVNHPAVVEVGDSPETCISDPRRQQRQPFEQVGADALALKFVFNRHRDFCSGGIPSDI